MSAHVTELLALAAAGALEASESERVAAHLAAVRGVRRPRRGMAPAG